AAKQIGGGMQMLDADAARDESLIPSIGKSITTWADEATKKYDILKPDIAEATGKESFLKRGVMGAIESTPGSLIPLAGAIAGGVVAGPVGAAVGGLGTLFGTFGLGEYQNTFEGTRKTLWEKGTPESEIDDIAGKHALKSAIAEAG